MDICQWEEKGHRYEVSFPDGAMRVVCSSRKGGSWQPDFDDTVRAEDLQYITFEDKGKWKYEDGHGFFPQDFSLYVRYGIGSKQDDRSRKSDDSRKLWWRLSCLDATTLAQLLEGLAELARSSPFELENMEELEKYASQARWIADADKRKRAAEEAGAAEAAALADAARSYGLEELERTEFHSSFPGPRDFLALAAFLLVIDFSPGEDSDASLLFTLLWVALLCISGLVFLVVILEDKKRNSLIKSQQLFLGDDSFMLVADNLGRGLWSWYTEGFDDPPRVARIDGYEVRKRKIVLHGRFYSGAVCRSDRRIVLQGAADAEPKAEDKLVIWRTFSGEGERRLLEELDLMSVR